MYVWHVSPAQGIRVDCYCAVLLAQRTHVNISCGKHHYAQLSISAMVGMVMFGDVHANAYEQL